MKKSTVPFFFNHLDKVITQNQVSKELEDGVLQAIITHTIQHLSQLDKPLSEIQQLYHTFIQNNNIPEENVPIELKTKIQVSTVEVQNVTTSASTALTSIASTSATVTSTLSLSPSSVSWNKNRKRKGAHQPAATKKRKHHFLAKGHSTQQPQT